MAEGLGASSTEIAVRNTRRFRLTRRRSSNVEAVLRMSRLVPPTERRVAPAGTGTARSLHARKRRLVSRHGCRSPAIKQRAAVQAGGTDCAPSADSQPYVRCPTCFHSSRHYRGDCNPWAERDDGGVDAPIRLPYAPAGRYSRGRGGPSACVVASLDQWNCLFEITDRANRQLQVAGYQNVQCCERRGYSPREARRSSDPPSRRRASSVSSGAPRRRRSFGDAGTRCSSFARPRGTFVPKPTEVRIERVEDDPKFSSASSSDSLTVLYVLVDFAGFLGPGDPVATPTAASAEAEAGPFRSSRAKRPRSSYWR